jgi:hypothetical protein
VRCQKIRLPSLCPIANNLKAIRQRERFNIKTIVIKKNLNTFAALKVSNVQQKINLLCKEKN